MPLWVQIGRVCIHDDYGWRQYGSRTGKLSSGAWSMGMLTVMMWLGRLDTCYRELWVEPAALRVQIGRVCIHDDYDWCRYGSRTGKLSSGACSMGMLTVMMWWGRLDTCYRELWVEHAALSADRANMHPWRLWLMSIRVQYNAIHKFFIYNWYMQSFRV